MIVCPNCASEQVDEVLTSAERTLFKCTRCKKMFEIFPPRKDFVSESPKVLKSGSVGPPISTLPSMNADMIPETSNKDESGKRLTQREKVLAFVKRRPDACLREISEILLIQKSTICLRIAELKRTGKVMQRHKMKTYKNHLVDTYIWTGK